MARGRVALEVDAVDMARIQRIIATIAAPKQAQITRRFLMTASAMLLRDATTNQIIRGGGFRGPAGKRGGKGKVKQTPPDPRRLTSRSGELRRSLSLNRGRDTAGLPKYIDVGTDLRYGAIHELGLGRYRARPFLLRAQRTVEPRLETILYAEIAKAIEVADGP